MASVLTLLLVAVMPPPPFCKGSVSLAEVVDVEMEPNIAIAEVDVRGLTVDVLSKMDEQERKLTRLIRRHARGTSTAR